MDTTNNKFQFDPVALSIVRTLRDNGYKAFFVGGCVRDILLGFVPKDIDIATNALPGEIEALFRVTIPVGKQFGVIIVVKAHKQYEVATFRKEKNYVDGRHPSEVIFSSEQEDVMRRDFTINGLMFDPFSREIIDYVGGQEDLKNKIIRTIGNPVQRFTEDKLRLLRGIRFSARFDFAIEQETFTAIRAMAPGVLECSAERIRDELIHIFIGKHPDKGLNLLDTSGLLQIVLPEVHRLKGVEQPPEFHPEGDVFTHTLIMFSHLKENPSKELAFGILLHDIGKPATITYEDRIRFNNHAGAGVEIAAEILNRLRFSNDEKDKILELIGNHMKFMNVKQMRMSRLKRFLRTPDFDDHMELHRLDCVASHGGLDNYYFCERKLHEFKEQETELRPLPLVTGNTLISLGLTPGPVFKKILREVEDLQLEGAITTEQDAVGYIKDNYVQ